MKHLSLFMILLCASCAHNTVQRPEKLEVRNQAGISIKSKRIMTIDTPNGGPLCLYAFDVKNAPSNRKFYLQGTDDLHPNYPPLELISDQYGCLRLATDKNARLNEYLYPMQGILPGEICTMWLFSEDKTTVVNASFIPYPLEALGTDGAEILVTRLEHNGSLVRCKGKYFTNNEQLEITSISKDKSISTPITCYNGSFSIDLSSPSSKNYSDMITLKIKRENRELMYVSYPIGREVYNKDLVMGNPTKWTQEDYDIIENAIESYYKKSSPDVTM